MIEILTLQQLRQRYDNYGLLKLDIEGAEYDALRGDSVWIRDNKPTIWAECNESPGAQQLLQFYLWANLTPYYIAFPAFRRNNFKQCKEDPYPIAYEAALLGGDKQLILNFISKLSATEIIVRKIESFEDLRKALWETPRWGLKEWLNLSTAELIALLGHAVKTGSYHDFIKRDSGGGIGK
ncbi:MAG: FkbM family methyltransferase [Candidatus Thiodiazotropha sp. (ex Gloverina cf. vestifex)]|nr:FkbM family methyltransferase [Candidatus Thiodiazotropha sp. (ex Gloverina cf. vestifex)]